MVCVRRQSAAGLEIWDRDSKLGDRRRQRNGWKRFKVEPPERGRRGPSQALIKQIRRNEQGFRIVVFLSLCLCFRVSLASCLPAVFM
jgi:hypothetical protein